MLTPECWHSLLLLQLRSLFIPLHRQYKVSVPKYSKSEVLPRFFFLHTDIKISQVENSTSCSFTSCTKLLKMLCEMTFSLMCMWYIRIINRFYVETWIPFPSYLIMYRCKDSKSNKNPNSEALLIMATQSACERIINF